MTGSGVPKVWQRVHDSASYQRTFQTEIEDFFALRYGRETPLPFKYYVAWPMLLFLGAGLIYAYPDYRAADWPRFAGIIGAALVTGFVFAWITRGFAEGFARGFWIGAAEKQGVLNQEVDMTLDASGLVVLVNGQSFHAPWTSLVAVEENDARYFFWIANRFAYVLPKHLFSDEEQADLQAKLTQWYGRAPVNPPRLAGYHAAAYVQRTVPQ